MTEPSSPSLCPEFVELTRCPHSRSPLALAEGSLLERVNRTIASGGAFTVGGDKIAEPWQQGLVNEAGTRLYPVRDGIVTLLVDEALDLERAGLVNAE